MDKRLLFSALVVLASDSADSAHNHAMRDAYARQIVEASDHRHVVAEQGRHFVQIDDPAFVQREVLALLEGLDNE